MEKIRVVGSKRTGAGEKSHHTCELALRRKNREEHIASELKRSVGKTNHFCLTISEGSTAMGGQP